MLVIHSSGVVTRLAELGEGERNGANAVEGGMGRMYQTQPNLQQSLRSFSIRSSRSSDRTPAM
jgi:hypothetical protein